MLGQGARHEINIFLMILWSVGINIYIIERFAEKIELKDERLLWMVTIFAIRTEINSFEIQARLPRSVSPVSGILGQGARHEINVCLLIFWSVCITIYLIERFDEEIELKDERLLWTVTIIAQKKNRTKFKPDFHEV